MIHSTMTYLSLFLMGLPILGLIGNGLSKKKSQMGAQFATLGIGIGVTLSLLLLAYCYVDQTPFYFLGFKADSLGFLMTSLIFFVSTVVHQFSIRYMAGDRNYKAYYYKLSLITSSAAIVALADQALLFFSAWCISNSLLISLMIHKQKWDAAAYSGKLAFKTLFSGATLFLVALALIYLETDSLSISAISQQNIHSPLMLTALVLCIITAITQSAIWPFHRWLTSSLNSPTPVSAIMHAGLVNGGGFLLVRLAPLFAEQPLLLNLIFLVGVISAVLGTLWKLVQTDVKRMLACSTMGQMGFMMIQCGLGLFPAAIAHLIWHGLFKAFLFLSAGSVVQNKKIDNQGRTSGLGVFIISCAYGLLGAYSFAWFSDKSFFSMNTTTFLVGFAFIASTQMAHALLKNNITFFRSLLAIAAAVFSGMVYGCSIHLIEAAIPSIISTHHAINALHLTAFLGFMSIWLVLNLEYFRFIQGSAFWKQSYITLLNGSQPHPETITSIRQTYQY
ncbi:MAG: proton-conducting transporter membrane subunit [Legionellaceae bacterium]|nr:proton-conducting transporter membrane subunit [Legionellaceae bacterium]